MATQPVTYKKVFGDYEIATTDVDGSTESQIVLRTEQVRIYGDLIVTGSQSIVSETNLAIKDRIAMLNEGEGGAGVTGQYSGLEVDRGSLDNALLIFDEVTDTWNISIDGGSSYEEILTTGTGLKNVVEDLTPQLGGNLDVNGKSIVSVTGGDITVSPDGSGQIVLDSSVLFENQVSSPGSTSGYNALYAQTPGAGGTGLYVQNSAVNDELVSKSKAIVFSIIF